MTGHLQLDNLTRTYRSAPQPALNRLTLDLPAGRCVVVVGPSGSGKSTVLRLIAGLDAPTTGSVHLDSHDLAGQPPEARGMAMVFQQPLLFPHLSVLDNVAFAPRVAGKSRAAARRHAQSYLDVVELGSYTGRGTSQLSGGQQQRVALARALAAEPHVLLLDEPFSALDAALRDTMHQLLRRIRSELNPTIVLVTHDQHEAVALGDTIAVLRQGELLQHDTADQLYSRPRSEVVHRLMGGRNAIAGTVRAGTHHSDLGPLALPDDLTASDGPALLVARQEAIELREPVRAAIRGEVVATRSLGGRRAVDIRIGRTTLHAEVPVGLTPGLGSTVGVEIPLVSRHVVPF